jgi:uncharacterized protein (TIGR02246 family)
MMIHAVLATISLTAPPTAERIPAVVRRTIAEANALWLQAMKRQDASAIAAIYGDRAVFITPDGDTLHGRAAIEDFERERFRTMGRVIDGTIEDDGVTQTGPYVYEWGHATLRVAQPDGTSSRVSGRFLTVWAADSSGRWRIIRNLSLPATYQAP